MAKTKIEILKEKGIEGVAGIGREYTLCPNCSKERKKSYSKTLAVQDGEKWFCNHCGWGGGISEKPPIKVEFEELTADQWDYFERRSISIKTLNQCGVKNVKNWIAFPYFYKNRLVGVKYRKEPKEFRMEKNSEQSLYLINLVKSNEIVITEGEIDALSFWELGIEAVSVPSGANQNLKYIENNLESLKDKIFTICTDNDEKGKQLQEALIKRLGVSNCKIMHLGDFKDANEVLRKSKDLLKEYYERAEYVKLTHIYEASDFLSSVLKYRRGEHYKGISTDSEIDRNMKIFEGTLTIVTGIPSHGKSNYMDYLTVKLIKKGIRVGIYSPENLMEMHLKRLYEIYSEKNFYESHENMISFGISEISKNTGFVYSENSRLSIDELFEKFEYLKRAKGVQVIIIDPFNTLEYNLSKNETYLQYVGKFLNRLKFKARELGVAFFLVAHPRKIETTAQGKAKMPTPYDIAHSSDFYNIADNIIIVHRHNKNEENEYTEVNFAKIKHSIIGEVGSITYKFDKEIQSYYTVEIPKETEYKTNIPKRKVQDESKF